jgi:spore germination protein KC
LFTTGEAVDILTIPPKWEKISAEEIRKEEKLQTGMSVHFNDFVDMLLADGVEPIAARVGPKYSEVMNKSDSGSEDSSHKLEKSIGITGAAVFHKDKLIGWMNDKEARGVKWLRNEIKDAVVTVNIPNEMGGGKISLRVLKANTKLKPIMIDNKVKMEVEVLAEHDLHENSSKLDLSNPEVIQYVDEKLRDNITERLQLVLDKAQKQFKSDIFGFGLAVYRSYPKEWKKQFKNRWDQEFPNLEVKITPHVKVVRTGLTNKSLTWEE